MEFSSRGRTAQFGAGQRLTPPDTPRTGKGAVRGDIANQLATEGA